MTLRYTHGSILKAPELIIAHGCNTKGAMGKGVALAIKERWPKVYAAYQYACASGALSLGDVSWAERADGAFVANVMTQSGYGTDPKTRYTSYDAVDRGLRKVIVDGRMRGLLHDNVVAVSMIGAGNGNAPWHITSAIIEQVSKDLGVDFNVYDTDLTKIENAVGGNSALVTKAPVQASLL